MSRAVRLVTVAGLGSDVDAEPQRISISAVHVAVLDDGSRAVLLDDRGWAESIRGPGIDESTDIWAVTTEDQIARTARMVVGPDEPFGDLTQADMEAGHWKTLAGTLRAQGVSADPEELSRLPHDVELTDALRARLGGG